MEEELVEGGLLSGDLFGGGGGGEEAAEEGGGKNYRGATRVMGAFREGSDGGGEVGEEAAAGGSDGGEHRGRGGWMEKEGIGKGCNKIKSNE